MLSQRENTLRAARFERPEWIPIHYAINASCWHHYPQGALQDLMEAHPLLFPAFRRREGPIEPAYAPWARAGRPYTASWGCVWETTDDGITGAVVGHPLADWASLDGYVPPDPATDFGWGPLDWAAERERLAAAPSKGRLASAALRHGHTFLTLTYLRGYDRLIYDMADDDPRLWRLIDMVEAFNLELVRRYIAAGAEWMSYPEDLGMQHGPMLSPALSSSEMPFPNAVMRSPSAVTSKRTVGSVPTRSFRVARAATRWRRSSRRARRSRTQSRLLRASEPGPAH